MTHTTHSPEFLAQYPKAYGRYKNAPPDYAKCAAGVYTGVWSGSQQCSRKNGHGPHGAYCKQHDPEAAKRRREESYAKYRAESQARQREHQFAADSKDAIRQIAAGHNDPRALAQSIIDKLEQDT